MWTGEEDIITVKTMTGEVIKSSEALEDLELVQTYNGKGYW